jgi:hypothetical protein
MKDVEKAVKFKPPVTNQKIDQNYDNMFEIILSQKLHVNSCWSLSPDRSEKFLKRFRSTSSDMFYKRSQFRNQGTSSGGSSQVSKATPQRIKRWQKAETQHTPQPDNSKSPSKGSDERAVSKWSDRMDVWNQYENRMVFRCDNAFDAEKWIARINNK